MKNRRIFLLFWRVVNVACVVSAIALFLAVAWEFSTRQYLMGFASGIVAGGSSSEDKVISIIHWMETGSARAGVADTDLLTVRNPENTLTSGKLLRICGSATNAFVNLANAAGVPARRLLLLNSSGTSNHVVAEVELDGRWCVVDPVFHIIPRDSNGRWLTASSLRDAAALSSVTRDIPSYRPDYNYLRTSHLRRSRIPFFGPLFGRVLDRISPGWDGAVFWTLLTERESFAASIGTIFLLFGFLVLAVVMWAYGRRRLGMSSAEMACPLHRAASMSPRTDQA